MLKEISFGWALWALSCAMFSLGVIWQAVGDLPTALMTIGGLGILTSAAYGIEKITSN